MSSPGTDRRLFKAAHYLESVGEKAAIKLNTPQQGRRNFTGEIKALEGDMVVVEVDGVEHQLLLTNIEKANIIPNLEF